MSKSCVIVSGGMYSPIPPVEDQFVIVCDKGYAFAERSHITPDLFIGDFDSFSGPVDETVPVQRHRKEKDDTDTILAVKEALARGYRDITIYCALGGRLDHQYANFQTAAFAAQQGALCVLRDAHNALYALKDGEIILPKQEGHSLSIFSFTDRCKGVTVRGAKYLLDDAELTGTFPLGVSNEWAQQEAVVRVREGILFVIVSSLD